MLLGIIGRSVVKGLSALLLYALFSGPAAAHEGGHGMQAMWEVCEGKRINDSCSFQNRKYDISRGSCQSMAGHLACVRNQPIEHASINDHVGVPDRQLQPIGGNNLPIWVMGALIILVGGLALFVWLRSALREG